MLREFCFISFVGVLEGCFVVLNPMRSLKFVASPTYVYVDVSVVTVA